MNLRKLFTHHPFFIRLFNWEYWSFDTIYGILYPYYAWLVIRAGFKYFFSASNPTIANGGFLMEMKQDIYPLIPSQYYPAYFFVKALTPYHIVEQQRKEHQFVYPLIAKPAIGMQGKAVKKILNEEDLQQYASVCTVDFLVQQLSPYKKEVGIFYYRYPDAPQGTITGIVAKEPMKVTGDGVSTLYLLICEEPRYILQMNELHQMHGAGLQKILAKGEELILAPYGNHARGSKFLDWTHKTDEALINSMDIICRQIQGFYFGRLDIMYDNWDDLRKGINFHIIELNGAGSDPTHMYDPKHSILFAWKEIVKHWIILYRISQQNHAKGHAYMSLKDGQEMFRLNKLLVKELDAMAKKL